MNEIPCRIELRNVTFAYEDHVVLDGVSLCVRPGELKIILGGSGTGKSTLLRLAIGLEKPDSGEVLVDGQDITQFDETKLNEVRRNIGMVFQEGALFDSLTVYENVAFRPREVGWPEQDVDREVRRVLEFVGLIEHADKLPVELSGGMRRRVAIARAIVDRPGLLLFDEPTSSLDPPTARMICDLIMRLRDVERVPSVLVTHEVEDVRYLTSRWVEIGSSGHAEVRGGDEQVRLTNTRCVLIRDGHIAFEGTDEQLWTNEDPYVRWFLAA
jgi:phospholipid/cholesterol/gamma-HCH transport system ATP-binding protein